MTVYILDDDRIELAIWEVNLLARHPEVTFLPFTKAIDLKEVCKQSTPDIAIIDLVLDLDSGVHTCKWLTENYPLCKLFVNTSFDTTEAVIASVCQAQYLNKYTPIFERVTKVSKLIQEIYNGN